jgi:hypothetical protein
MAQAQPGSVYPILVNFTPKSGTAISDLTPEITLDWSCDILETQFSDPAQLAQRIQLYPESASSLLQLTYVSYSVVNRRVTVTPASALNSGTTYRIVVPIGTTASGNNGRSSRQSYTWVFSTEDSTVIEASNFSPSNYTIQETDPTFTWSSAGSGVTYHLQLAQVPGFSTLVYENTAVAASSITPSVAYTAGTTYYWRIRTISASASSNWSDTFQFYYGSIEAADVTSNQTYSGYKNFAITYSSLDKQYANRSTYPTISFEFNSTPASSYTSYIEVVRKSQLPRNDVSNDYSEQTVAGNWSLVSNILTFTPTDAITGNSRYTIRFDSRFPNTDGSLLGENKEYFFTSNYTPLYADIRELQAYFAAGIVDLPDDFLYYHIYMASLEANARWYAGGMIVAMDESIVRDVPNQQTYTVSRWTRAKAIYTLLFSILQSDIRNVGRNRKLGDYAESLGEDYVNAIKKALDEAKKDLDDQENQLTASNAVGFVSRSSEWCPEYWAYDGSVADVVYRRGEGF